MICIISVIFSIIFIIVNRMFLSPADMGLLILLTLIVCTLEVYLYGIMRELKNK